MKPINERTINYEQLLSSALIKFGMLDCYDIILLIKGLYPDFEVNVSDKNLLRYIKFIKSYGRTVTFEEGRAFKVMGNREEHIVRDYLDNIDLELFVLSKISLMTSIRESDLEFLFNSTFLEVTHSLLDKGDLSLERDRIILSASGEKRLNEGEPFSKSYK